MDKKELWKTVLETLRINLSSANFSTWFPQTYVDEIKSVSDKHQIVQIACPSSFVRDTVENRYFGQLKEILDQLTQNQCDLVFLVKPAVADTLKSSPAPLFDRPTVSSPPQTTLAPIQNQNHHGLNPNFSLETFIVGSSNNLAHAAAEGIVNTPGKAYNPFFIYGGVGVGKTHLMQAIGQAIGQKNPNHKILYVTAETFTNELISSLQNKTIQKFKKKYRETDVLLIDDVQFIAGKESTQEEFFHTFNALYMQDKQIILTSDRKPEELGGIKDRLISRFMGGLTVDIQLPDYEMRIAILKQKCRRLQQEVSEEVLDLIASQIQSNTRELEGALSQILARAQATHQPVTIEFVSEFFGVKKREQLEKISPKRILSTVAKTSELRVKDLTGQSRKAPVTKARQIAMYLIRKDLKVPLTQIGELFSGRDHTTVMHSVEKIEKLFGTNQQVRHEVLSMRSSLFKA